MISDQSHHFLQNLLVIGHHTAVTHTQTTEYVVVLRLVFQGYLHMTFYKDE